METSAPQLQNTILPQPGWNYSTLATSRTSVENFQRDPLFVTAFNYGSINPVSLLSLKLLTTRFYSAVSKKVLVLHSEQKISKLDSEENHKSEDSVVQDKAPLNEIKPVAVYLDADIDKQKILYENIKTICVYRWVNKVNGNTYVGEFCGSSREIIRLL